MDSLEGWIAAALPLILGAALGTAVDKCLLPRLQRSAGRRRRLLGVITGESLRGVAFILFLLAGAYATVLRLPLDHRTLSAVTRAVAAAAVAAGVVAAGKAAARWASLYSSRSKDVLPSTTLFSNIAQSVVYALGVVIILQSLGIPVAPIVTALGVGGLAVALALQDTLSNLFSGLNVIVARQIKPGDYVKLGSGEEGFVADITWRTTTIRALSNNLVVVPNSKLASAIITNYSLPSADMSVLVEVGVAFGSDLEKVERVTVEVAKEVMREVPGGVPEHGPFVRFGSFGDPNIRFTAILRSQDYVGQYLVKHEFIKRLHKRYAKEGIRIAIPTSMVYLDSHAPAKTDSPID